MQGKTPKSRKKPKAPRAAKSSKTRTVSEKRLNEAQFEGPFTDFERSVSLYRAFHNFIVSRKSGPTGVFFTKVVVKFFDGRSPEIRLDISKSEATYLIPRKKNESKKEAEQRRSRAYGDFLPMVAAANTKATSEFILLLPPSELSKFLHKYSRMKP